MTHWKVFVYSAGWKGIIPALETARCELDRCTKGRWAKNEAVLLCVSGRGDKDVAQVSEMNILETTLSPAAAAGQTRGLEHLDPPFSPSLIEELLRLIAKTARAHQLYLPNNPIYRGAIDSLRAGFVAIWNETDEITLVIAESEFLWSDVSVWRDAAGTSKTPDSLPWLFYKDGVRELTLTKGFEAQEALTFLEMIQRARKATADEDDLVTMLWEADFTFLKYAYVDLLHDGGGGALADGGEAAPVAAEEVHRAAREVVEQPRSGGIVDMADFDATLYFLDDREIEYLQSEIVREYQQDLRVNISGALLDIFEGRSTSKSARRCSTIWKHSWCTC